MNIVPFPLFVSFMWLLLATLSWTSGNFAKTFFSSSASDVHTMIIGPVTKLPLLVLFIAASLVSVCALSLLFLSPWIYQEYLDHIHF
jgi:hypothetical protein